MRDDDEISPEERARVKAGFTRLIGEKEVRPLLKPPMTKERLAKQDAMFGTDDRSDEAIARRLGIPYVKNERRDDRG